jgi:hypothetical protein
MTALLLALLAVLPQAEPPREKTAGFTFALPKGWARQEGQNGAVMLMPEGTKGEMASVFIFPGTTGDFSDTTFHEQLYQNMTRGAKLDGFPERGIVGSWSFSKVKLTTPQGQPAWLALYTAQAGTRFEAVLFAAANEEKFKAHAGAIEAMVADIELPGKPKKIPSVGTTIHGLVIPIPADWQRKDDPGGGVYLSPPADRNPLGTLLFVLPPSKMQGTPWESHKILLKHALAWAGVKEEGATILPDPNVPGPFIRSTATGRLASGEWREIQLWTAAHDGILEAITIVNKHDSNVLWPILKQVTFKDPPKQERPQVVEAYRKLVRKMYTNPGGAALAYGSIMYDRMWLRSDGCADFSPWYIEGYAASPYVFKLDPGLLTGLAGAWRKIGDDKVEIRRTAADPPIVYQRVDGKLGEWEPMPRVDGMKLSGRYAKKSQKGAIVEFYYWMDFTEDGKFKTDGLLTFLGGLDIDWPKFPDKLSGTYEIRDWTIFFKFDDGRTWSTDFSTLNRDPNDKTGILFRTTVVLKE